MYGYSDGVSFFSLGVIHRKPIYITIQLVCALYRPLSACQQHHSLTASMHALELSRHGESKKTFVFQKEFVWATLEQLKK